MENYQSNWIRCLAMIREWLGANIKDSEQAAHIYDVWFKDITLNSYDPVQRVVTLMVPSTYVYEYIEQYFVRLMCHVISTAFQPGVRLQYMLGRPEPTFSDVAEYLRQHSAYDSRRDPYHVRIPDAKKRLQDGLRYFLKGKEQWLPGTDGYDSIADWLTDNKGRGLLVCGAPGLGKSLICQKILPVILGNGGRPIPSVNAKDLHDRIEDLKRERIVIIDDLGKEPRKHYGDIDNSFYELCNNAERTGQLLIITTNLSTTPMPSTHPNAHLYPDSILGRYGQDVISRLKATTVVVEFLGSDMRK